MREKGFTLVELLGVVVILGLLAAFTIPALTNTLKESSEKEYNNYVKNMTMAAENYFHSETDGNLDQKVFLNIGTLVEKGYLKKEKNPKTRQQTSDSDTIIISKNEDGTEKYEFVNFDATEKGYISNGLLAHYDGYTKPVNNIWRDLSGNGNDGTIMGAIWQNDSYYFDGTDDYVKIDTLNLGNYTDITVSIVYKIVAFGSNNIGIFGTTNTGGGRLFMGYNYASKCAHNSSAPDNWVVANCNLQPGKTYSQTNIYKNKNASVKNQIYLNNILKVENNTLMTSDWYTPEITIGKAFGGSISNTYIYSVQIYNHALSKDEIKQNYNIDKVRFGIKD